MRQPTRSRKHRNLRRALILAPALATAGCTTTDMELLNLALQLYEASSYMNGDCPYGQSTYYDTWNDRFSCGYGVRDGDSRRRGGRGGHHDHDDDSGGDAGGGSGGDDAGGAVITDSN